MRANNNNNRRRIDDWNKTMNSADGRNNKAQDSTSQAKPVGTISALQHTSPDNPVSIFCSKIVALYSLAQGGFL